ncbi:Hypothetical_protein [Hexamita inflata]|uniref:Hypothetical_protein n=1 Tax=Hexamita inflata TaxID=28002 RepID=A0AA86QZ68_9EUKA|nr:Hypothetical protein HINF_LOCUS56449 [Hexamita inflata]
MKFQIWIIQQSRVGLNLPYTIYHYFTIIPYYYDHLLILLELEKFIFSCKYTFGKIQQFERTQMNVMDNQEYICQHIQIGICFWARRFNQIRRFNLIERQTCTSSLCVIMQLQISQYFQQLYRPIFQKQNPTNVSLIVPLNKKFLIYPVKVENKQLLFKLPRQLEMGNLTWELQN